MIKKRLVTSLLTVVFILAFMPAASATTSGAVGYYHYTDIVTYLWGVPVNAISIGGRTMIDAESMAHYGFTVTWLPEQRRLELQDSITQKADDTAASGALLDMAAGQAGRIAGRYYRTDIVTTLNGKEIESRNIGGRTFIAAESMRDFGYTVDWDAVLRRLTITLPLLPLGMTPFDVSLQHIRELWSFKSLWEYETDTCMIIYGVQNGTSHGNAYMLQLIYKVDGKSVNIISQTGLGSGLGRYPLLYDFSMSSDDKTLYFSCDANGVTYHFQTDLSTGAVTKTNAG
jgi:hypothetical protein